MPFDLQRGEGALHLVVVVLAAAAAVAVAVAAVAVAVVEVAVVVVGSAVLGDHAGVAFAPCSV